VEEKIKQSNPSLHRYLFTVTTFSKLLAIVLFIVLPFVGFYLGMKYQQKVTLTAPVVSDVQKNTIPTPIPALPGLSKYEDAYVSFYYPSDWKIKNQYELSDSNGAYLLSIIAPVDNSLTSARTKNKNLYFSASILIAKNDRFQRLCKEDCTVYSVEKVSPKSPSSNGMLVVSDWGSQGYPQVVEYTRNAAIISQKSYELGFDVGQSYFARVYGNYMSGEVSFVQLKNPTDVQNSKAYKQLLQLIPTLTVKAANLP
jgi:hypothetical protein